MIGFLKGVALRTVSVGEGGSFKPSPTTDYAPRAKRLRGLLRHS